MEREIVRKGGRKRETGEGRKEGEIERERARGGGTCI